MVILQVVGYKNSGKTTLMAALINFLISNHVKVASLKHHGHGGLPAGFENTDSEQHKQAGAIVAGVLGGNILQLSNTKWDMDKIFPFYEQMDIEILLLEGFKNLSFPKLVIVKEEEDLSFLTSLHNVIGIIKSDALHVPPQNIPIFNWNDIQQLSEWVYNNYKKGVF